MGWPEAIGVCVLCGGHVFFSQCRCLEDNEWNFTSAVQAFYTLQVRPGKQAGKDGCVWAFSIMEGVSLGVELGPLALLMS